MSTAKTSRGSKMSQTYATLKAAAESAGTNLNVVCREAKIDRSVLERWKKREPKTIQILMALQAAIAVEKQKKTEKNTSEITEVDFEETPVNDAPVADTPVADMETKTARMRERISELEKQSGETPDWL